MKNKKIDQRWYMHFDRICSDPALKGRIVDVGAKHGTLALKLAELYEVAAIDQDAENVAIMRELAAQKGIELQIHKASIEELPFEDASVDTVVLSQVVEHVRNPMHLKELVRILKPSGVIILTTNFGFAHWAPDHCWFFLPQDTYHLLQHGWFFVKESELAPYAFLRFHTVVPFEGFCETNISPFFEYQLYEQHESSRESLEIYCHIYKTSHQYAFPQTNGETIWRHIASRALTEHMLSSPSGQ